MNNNDSGRYSPAYWALLLISLIGVTACFINSDLMIVRNASIYAMVADLLLSGDFSVPQIVSEYELGLGKPILFSIFAMPFIKIWGLNQGMIVASFSSTMLFLASSFFFFKHFNSIFKIPKALLALQILLTFFNPLVIYQFWSAYPDSLFAALSVASIIFLDKSLRERRYFYVKSLIYFSLVFLAILTKYVGAILPLAHLIYVLLHHKTLKKNILSYPRKHLWIGTLAVLLSIAIITSLIGQNPILSMGKGSGGGFEGVFNLLETLIDIPFNIVSFFFLILFIFNVMSFYLLKSLPNSKFYPLLAMASINLVPYFLFWASHFNIRFYLHFFPLLALLVSSVLTLPEFKGRERAFVMLFLVINAASIGLFNHRGLYSETLAKIDIPIFFENLRIGAQVEKSCLAEKITSLDATPEEKATIQWTFEYYNSIDLKYMKRVSKNKSVIFNALDQFSNSREDRDNLYIYAFLEGDVFTKEIPPHVKKWLSTVNLKDYGCNLYKVTRFK